MGMFDSLYAKLECPKTNKLDEIEIQLKWAEPSLARYNIGDQLHVGPYGSLWIPEDYLCEKCSVMENRRYKSFEFHDVAIHIDNGIFLEVLTMKEFESKFVKDGEISLPHEEKIFTFYGHEFPFK